MKSHLITDLIVIDGHSFVDNDAGKISAERHRERVERGEVPHRLGPHQLEEGVAVAFRHPEVERVDAGSFHLDQKTLRNDKTLLIKLNFGISRAGVK